MLLNLRGSLWHNCVPVDQVGLPTGAVRRPPRESVKTPNDQWGSAQAIQGVQQSAFSDGSNYARHYKWALELTQQETPVVVSASSPVTAPAPIGASVQRGTVPAPSETLSSVSPASTTIAQPLREEEPNWFGIGIDGIVRRGSAATDSSQGWLWEDPDDHKLRFIHQKPPAKAPDSG